MRFRYSLLALALAFLTTAAFAQQVPRPAGEFAISMSNGNQALLSQYSGKVIMLMFMFTTCPHCQHTTQLLTPIVKEYAPRGVQVLGVAFNDGANSLVPGFVSQFKPAFPVGSSLRPQVDEYLQHVAGKPSYVPELVFIDRNRVIRGQFGGTDDFLKDQEKNIRAMLDTLLKEPVAAKKTSAHKKRS